jgi:hypothetical protein
MAETGGAPPRGDFGDELHRLAGGLQDWMRQTFPASQIASGQECQWCPLCQFIALLRGEHPELTQRVAEAGTALAGAMKALTEAAATRTPGAPGAPGAPPPTGSDRGRDRPRPSPRVQHIRLDDPGES